MKEDRRWVQACCILKRRSQRPKPAHFVPRREILGHRGAPQGAHQELAIPMLVHSSSLAQVTSFLEVVAHPVIDDLETDTRPSIGPLRLGKATDAQEPRQAFILFDNLTYTDCLTNEG